MTETIRLHPIGHVKSDFATNTPAEEMRRHPSQIIVDPSLAAGLLGLKPGDDILVLFWLHRVKPEEIELQLHPRHNPDNPLTGVFATRTQFRPNQIAATVARLEKIEEQTLTVSQLDAQDGAPVLDIKPVSHFFDADTRTQQFEVREVDSLPAAREAIDRIDAEIVRLLGNRARYVHQVVRFKERPEDVPAWDRYDQVMQQRRELAEQHGLNPDVIEQMYKLLVDNFIQEELEIMRRRQSMQGAAGV